jgi:SpoVK/Ycf46/Vps4 family AAA+-type ATPase
MNMIDHLEKIIELAKEYCFTNVFFANAGEHLNAVSELLHITPKQAALFSVVFENYNDTFTMNTVDETLKCGKMQLLRYMDDIDVLKKNKLIREARESEYSRHRDKGPRYQIPKDVINAIRKGVECKFTRNNENLSPEEFFDYAEEMLNAVVDDEMDIDDLNEEIKFLLESNKNICFVKKKAEYDLGEDSVILMFIFCCELLCHDNESTELSIFWNILINVFGHSKMYQFKKKFKSRELKLMQKGLVEYEFENGMADTNYIRLTQKAKEEFLSDFDLKEKTKHRGKDFIRAENIPIKKLFYNEKIRSRIGELTKLLCMENFSGIQKRLGESSMRTGFACIFSGPPGTGKTETAYQIARETGRDIMLVNISETKSMWFGESEKRIKAVFDRYRGIIKDNCPAPILLFNEADAVLGKRRELTNSRSGPDQTENAIQNIILQEMENLNGILIATTNMTSNFDKAFERRFLYKINFDKPDIESKKLMWQSFIPDLSGSDAERLASKFDFSGGQIENIARKSAVSFILKGTKADILALETFCGEELYETTANRIGFTA